MNKVVVRKKMILVRKNMSNGERANASLRISETVISLPMWKQAKTICVYESLPSEVNTKMILEIARKQKKIIRWDNADLYIVPGVAFDKKGNRLGRGRGYYDRLLERIKKPKIGLAFDQQVIAEVPHTSYDVPMDVVITENNIYEK